MVALRKIYRLAAFAIICVFLSCTKTQPIALTLEEDVFVPKPVDLIATGSSFQLNENTKIVFDEANAEDISEMATLLSEKLNTMFSICPEIANSSSRKKTNTIYFGIDSTSKKEGYQLTITEDYMAIDAATKAGLFYGIQSLMQLLNNGAVLDNELQFVWIPTGSITDYPKYEYRGAMLDVARHFFAKEDVFTFIDYLTEFKMNVLHLHLSDDQGWRIEIKSWPKLTSHGGSTQVGGGKGGYYTQEDYKEIVAYAAERCITIIPEIDMPGHTNAALASYPELNCNGIATQLYTGTRVGFSTLCTDKEITYRFVDDVVRELAALSPGPYIHIGGDESHVTPLKDYIPFINRVKDIVEKHNKQIIGWDEIAHADLDARSVVQYWSNAENSLKGVAKGAKVIISPAKRAYLDMKYDSITKLGLNWAGYIEVDHGYNWSPNEIVEGISDMEILGVEAPLWSETVTTLEEIEYMIFPRLLGYAEIGWTQDSLRSWEDYSQRLLKYLPQLKDRGINYYDSPVLQTVEVETDKK